MASDPPQTGVDDATKTAAVVKAAKAAETAKAAAIAEKAAKAAEAAEAAEAANAAGAIHQVSQLGPQDGAELKSEVQLRHTKLDHDLRISSEAQPGLGK
ncbi:hypothetical protein RHMOL_Rhmol06G0002700 [Rhododendron molle]|uniref:Uncharacterized protein n=1 Tax=Rhododendron molle TaxID=49168 RepID=A0ACC0N916_RHOML|nr:hypothetical protein RHMOL_Rhmol06G0002700 [Rhododendron molle]